MPLGSLRWPQKKPQSGGTAPTEPSLRVHHSVVQYFGDPLVPAVHPLLARCPEPPQHAAISDGDGDGRREGGKDGEEGVRVCSALPLWRGELQPSPCPLPGRSNLGAPRGRPPPPPPPPPCVSSSCRTALFLPPTSCPPERSAGSAASQRVAGRGYWQSHLALRVPKPGITPPSGLPCPAGREQDGGRERERRTQHQEGDYRWGWTGSAAPAEEMASGGG